MSAKKDVIDTIATALGTITGVKQVIQVAKGMTQIEPTDFPTLYLKDVVVDKDLFAFPASTASNYFDTEALMSLEIQGKIFSITDEPSTPTDNLLQSVEKKLATSTAVNAIVKEIYPVSDDTDEEMQDNFSSFTQRFEVRYFYNHANP